MNSDQLLAALQLADPALPIGRFAHSLGLEAMLIAHPDLADSDLQELVETVLIEVAGPLDGAAAALAASAAATPDLVALDRRLTALRLTPASREASVSCGRRLAALAPTLTLRDPAHSFCELVRDDDTGGNLAVVEGTIAAAIGLDPQAAATLSVRGSATALLSAAVRLGRLSASRSQQLIRQLQPTLIEAVRLATATRADDLRATAPELDVYALAHARADARSFIT